MKGKISKDLEQNIAYLEAVFSDCNDIVKKKFYVGKKKNTGMYVIYTDGLAKADMIQENVLEPLLTDPLHPLKESVTSWVIESADRKWSRPWMKLSRPFYQEIRYCFLTGLIREFLYPASFSLPEECRKLTGK